MNNLQIAELLRNVASSYQYKDEQKFKFQIIAYNRAADAVEHSTSELKDMWDNGKLDEVPSIGPSIASHLDEIFKTGRSKHFEEIMKGIPETAFKLMILPKVGMKTAMKMIDELPKSELSQKINEANKLLTKTKRHLLPYAENLASEVIEWLKTSPYLENVDVLGSVRRKCATVGDVDILANSKFKSQNSKLLEHFINYPKTLKVIEKGKHTASILLPNNVQVDLLVTDPTSYGSALQHFTGSKHHNIALREHALKKGYSLSEYGVKIVESQKSKVKKFKTEKELYNFLSLQYIEPELREGVGEIEASLRQAQGKLNALPNLIKLEDVKGDLQIHSDFNIETSHDLGISSMEVIAKRGQVLGYEYIAFTEHNPSKKNHSAKEIEDLLKNKREKIDQLNYSREKGIPFMFNSLEIDIRTDGSLSVPEKGLELLDFALVSIHSSFDLGRVEQTKRLLVALSHPKVKIFAHPTARKINEREGVELDWDKIFDFCLLNNKFIEINADPKRLDLPDTLVRDAVKKKVKLTLGTDTHEVSMMDNMKYGVYVARRGWSQEKDVINCLDLDNFKEVINN